MKSLLVAMLLFVPASNAETPQSPQNQQNPHRVQTVEVPMTEMMRVYRHLAAQEAKIEHLNAAVKMWYIAAKELRCT